jgi:hypothetical protein
VHLNVFIYVLKQNVFITEHLKEDLSVHNEYYVDGAFQALSDELMTHIFSVSVLLYTTQSEHYSVTHPC